MKTSIAFTGHRNITMDIDELKEALLHTIEEQYQSGFRSFYNGMAMGFDLLAAECVLEMREKYADIRLICVVPFKYQHNRYNETDKNRWLSIMEQADDSICISEKYFKECFFRRNEYLVDHSSQIIAYYNGTYQSGTAQTVRKATVQSKPIINLYNLK